MFELYYRIPSVTQGADGNIMHFLIIVLVAQDIVVDRLEGQWYENEFGISLICKEYDHRDCTWQVECAVVAANEAIYDFGFVVQD